MSDIKLNLRVDEDNYCRLNSNYTELDGKWEDIYVNISGHFGSFNPKMFQYAPEMFQMLTHLIEEYKRSNSLSTELGVDLLSRSMMLLDVIEESGNE